MKILVIRFSSIGDIVLTSPIVRCLHNKYPKSEIHFLTKDKFVELVENNPNVSAVHSINGTNDTAIFNNLKTEKYDLVIDLHKNLRTRKLKRLLNAPKWYSFKKLNIQKWLLVNFKINFLPKKHIVDRYFDCLKGLNIVNDKVGIDFHFPQGFTMDLGKYNLDNGGYSVVVIGGTYRTKQIPKNLLLSIFKRLNGSIIMIGGGNDDEQKAKELQESYPNSNLVNLCNTLSIDESAYLIKNAKTLYTSDTGMMHIASAFDTQIEAIWGNTNPAFGMYAYRPSGVNIDDHIVSLKCNPCSKLGSNICPRGHFKCMNMQNVEQIVKNC
ncbi:MAG: glycosyl transferase [Bacteroidetes bacterium]|nr:MAG: glycosyl transferase [Bacteroidota bacterium]